jgi:hypothetical protein
VKGLIPNVFPASPPLSFQKIKQLIPVHGPNGIDELIAFCIMGGARFIETINDFFLFATERMPLLIKRVNFAFHAQ